MRPRPCRRTGIPATVALLAVAACAAVLAACSDDPGEGAPFTEPTAATTTVTTGREPSTDPDDDQGAIDLGVPVRLVDLGLDLHEPIAASYVAGTSSAQRSSSVLIAERAGVVHEVVLDGDRAELVDGPLLDMSELVGSAGGERGLLGIAVAPDAQALIVSYTAATDGGSRIDRYGLAGRPGDLRVDAGSRSSLLQVDQPYPNHNGGHVAFGLDGLLYVGLGDGGSGGDPQGNGQDPTTLLGKLLRIDADDPANVPADNPFVDRRDGARPEIWLTGVRNPWRFAFDADTGDLWIADVGQNSREEINRLLATEGGGRGANLGWDLYEGDEEFGDPDPGPGTWSDGPFIEPLHTYGRDRGCSITGGVVYRGAAIPQLRGAFLYADYCGRGVRALDPSGEPPTAAELGDAPLSEIVGFAEAPGGEVLVISLSAGVSLLTPA